MSSPQDIDIQKLLKTKVDFRSIPTSIKTKSDVLKALTASTNRIGFSLAQDLRKLSDHFAVSVSTQAFERLLVAIPQVLGEDDNYV